MSTPENPINPYAAPQSVPEDGHSPLDYFGSEDVLHRVATGLNLVYWGIALFLICFFGVISVVFLTQAAPIKVLGILIMLFSLGILVSFILGLAGRIFCLSVPAASGARGLIYTAVAFDLLAIFLAIAQQVIDLPMLSSPATSFLSILATILFIVFLKRVATYIRQPDLASQAQALILMGIFLIVLLVVMGASMVVIGLLAGLIGPVILVVGILMLLRYIRLLVNLRRQILNR